MAARLTSTAKHFVRAMSSQAAPAAKREFLVIIPDKPGTLQKRLEVRPAHLEGVKPFAANGTFKMGGGLLNSVPEGTDPSTFDFHGSSFIAIAESKEKVIDLLKDDIYVKSGVWDLEKAQVFPFLCAFRNP